MTKNKWIRTLTITTVILVSLVAVVSFSLSYRNLVLVALDAGMERLEALLWPALIDAPLLVFSIAGILARTQRRRYWPYLIMVSGYALLSMYFNSPIPHSLFVVFLVAPLSFILSFETLTSIVSRQATRAKAEVKPKQHIKRDKAIELYNANGHNISETARELNISRYKVGQLIAEDSN